MEANKHNNITARQAMIFILSIQIGIGILTMPSAVTEFAGHDSWISVMLSGIIVLLAMWIITVLCKRFDGSSIIDINKIIFGKYIAFVLNLLLIIYLLFATIANLKLVALGVGIWFFRITPVWIITLYLMLPSIYLSYYGLKGICRFNSMIYTSIFGILGIALLNILNFRVTELLPIGVHGFTGVIKAMPPSAFAFMGFETILFIFPFIKDKEKIGKNVLMGILITTAIYVFFVIISLGVFSEELLRRRYVSIIGLARMIRVPVLDRVDLYFLALWTPSMLLTINAYLFLAYNSVKQVFKTKAKAIPLAIISIIVLFASAFNEDSSIVNMLNQYSGYASFFVGAIVPLFLLIIAFMTRKGVKAKE